MIAFAAIFAVLGMVLLVPLLLVGLARVSGRLPLALRFAIRDAARNRTRTVPAVAAVAATVAGVVALGVANSSDAAQNRDQYVPMLAAGDGIVRAYEARPEDWAPIGQVLQRELPGATVTPLEGVPEGGVNGPSVSLRFRGAGRTDFLYSYGSHLGASLLVGDRLPELPDLPRDQVAALNRTLAAGGAVLFANELPDASDVTVSGRRFNADGTPADRIKPQSIKAAFAQVPQDASVPQAVLSPELAQRLGVQVATVAMYVSGAEISPDQARNAGEAVAAIVPYADLYVERGYTGDDATRILLLILGGLGAVLMLGGTLTTTYLALSDARPDLATLAAVGAAPRMRRGVAGAFAVVVALVGGLVGAVIGFIPGVAVTYPLTSTVGDSYVSSGSGSSGFNGDFPPATGPYLDIPWLLVGTLVIGLPLVTALVVSLTTRSRLPLIARVD
jgi:putative ABC transport system permease protein